MPPGAGVRTLTLFLTADSAALSSTLYRSSLEIGRYQSKVEAGNAASGAAQLGAINRQAAADMAAGQQRIATFEKTSLAYAKQMNDEIITATVAAAKRVQIEEEAQVAIRAAQAKRDVQAVFATGVATTLADIEAEKVARAAAIKETEAIGLSSARIVADGELAAAEATAASEIAIANGVAKEKQAIAARMRLTNPVGANAAVVEAQAELAARLAAIEQERLAAIAASESKYAQEVVNIKATAVQARAANAATAREAVSDTRIAAGEKQSIELQRIAREAAAEKAAIETRTEQDIAAAKTAGQAKLSIQSRNIAASAAMQRDTLVAEVTGKRENDLAIAQREIEIAERRTRALGALKVATLAVGVATTVALAEAVKMGIEFEREMRNVASISPQLQGSATAIQAVGDQVLRLSTILPQGGADLARGLYEITSSGFADSAGGLKVLTESAKSATAGLTTTETAAKGLTEVMNAYGLEATEAGKVSDVMFQTINLGIVNFEQLTATLGTVIGTAATAGVSFEQLGAAYAAITRAGVGPEETATSLSRIITSFIQPTEELATLTRLWGYETAAQALESEGLYGALMKVKEATQGDLSATVALFPEKRALRGVLAALTNDGKNYQETFRGIGQANAAAGATSRALKEQLQATGAQLEIMKNKAAAVGIQLAGPVLGWIKDALPDLEKFVTLMAKGISDGVEYIEPGLRDFAESLQNIFTVIGAVADITGTILKPALIGVGTAFNGIMSVLQNLTQFLAENTDLVKFLAAAITLSLIPALVTATARLAAMTAVGIANALTRLSVLMGATAAATTTVAAAQTTATASTLTLTASMGALGTSLVAVAGRMAALSPYVAAGFLVYDLWTEKANKVAEAHKFARKEIDKIISENDITTIQGLDKAVQDLYDNSKNRAKNQTNKEFFEQEIVFAGTKNGRPTFTQADGSPVGDNSKAVNAETAKEVEALVIKRINIQREVGAVNAEISKLFKTEVSSERIEKAARKLNIDLTLPFSDPDAVAGRDRLLSYFKDELPSAVSLFGKDLAKLTEDQLDNLIALTDATDKFAAKVKNSFVDAFDPIKNFKLTDDVKAKENVLGLDKEIAIAEKQLKALQTKALTGGTKATETDALTAATIRLDRAQDDANASSEAFGRTWDKTDYQKKTAAIEEQRKALKATIQAAIENRDTLVARKAGGDTSVRQSDIASANTAITRAREAELKFIEVSKTADAVTGDAASRKAILAERKVADAERALAIAQRKATDNPFSEADKAEVDRLIALIALKKKELKAAQLEAAPPSDQLRSFYRAQLKDASDFNNNLSKLFERGLNPQTISQILEAGPKASGDFVKALLADTTGEIIKAANTNQKTLDGFANRAAYMSRLTYLALNSNSTTLLDELGTAQKIQDTVLKLGSRADLGTVSKALGMKKEDVAKVAADFGIGVRNASGLSVALAAVPADAKNASSGVAGAVQRMTRPFDLMRESVENVSKAIMELPLFASQASTEMSKYSDPLMGEFMEKFKGARSALLGGNAPLAASPQPTVPQPATAAGAEKSPGLFPIIRNITNFNGDVKGATPPQAAQWAKTKKREAAATGSRG
jgi:TP901 family phage tail tape measure protein